MFTRDYDFYIGTLQYQLIATDDEGDLIKFQLDEDEFALGEVNLTSDGL